MGRWAAARPRAGWDPGSCTRVPRGIAAPTNRGKNHQPHPGISIGRGTVRVITWRNVPAPCPTAGAQRGLWVLQPRGASGGCTGGWHPQSARGPLHSHTPRKGTPTHPHAPPGRALAASGPPPAGPPRPGRLSAVAGDVVPPRGPLPCPPPAAAGCSERNSRMGTPALLSLLRVHEVRVTGGMWKKIIKTIKEKITTRRQGEMHDSPRSRCKLGLWSPARSFTQQNQAHGLSRTSWAGQPGPAERCDAAWRLRRRSGSALGIH